MSRTILHTLSDAIAEAFEDSEATFKTCDGCGRKRMGDKPLCMACRKPRKKNETPDHIEARILYYQDRASRGLPLFDEVPS